MLFGILIFATKLVALVAYTEFTTVVPLPCEKPKSKFTVVPLPWLKWVFAPVIVTSNVCPLFAEIGETEFKVGGGIPLTRKPLFNSRDYKLFDVGDNKRLWVKY